MTSTAPPLQHTPATAPDLDLRRAGFTGELLTPADGSRYDAARAVFNGLFDRRPAVIARATGEADVAAAVRVARDTQRTLAVKAGGHSVAGYSSIDDGLLLDLSPLKGISVDPVGRTARVQPGVVWGELDAATQRHGLATTGGRMTTTGVAGFVLGSGSGWLERLHGYAADNLLAARVVLADGRVVTASADERPDLFWALRGGGGNFGVVTEFTLRLHPVGPVVYGGILMHPRDRAPSVCRFFRDFMQQAPPEVGGGLILMTAPPAPFVPPDLQGRPVVTLFTVHFGPLEVAEAALAPLRGHGAPAVDTVGPIRYVDFQALTDAGNPAGRRNYWHSELLPRLADGAIDALLAGADAATSPTSIVVMAPAGGALAQVPEDALPLGGRSAGWFYHCYGIWTDTDDDRHRTWVRDTARAVRPFTSAGMALNFVSEVDDARVRATFGEQKYRRLVAVKDRYDPGNLFRMNQNVKPSGHRHAEVPAARP